MTAACGRAGQQIPARIEAEGRQFGGGPGADSRPRTTVIAGSHDLYFPADDCAETGRPDSPGPASSGGVVLEASGRQSARDAGRAGRDPRPVENLLRTFLRHLLKPMTGPARYARPRASAISFFSFSDLFGVQPRQASCPASAALTSWPDGRVRRLCRLAGHDPQADPGRAPRTPIPPAWLVRPGQRNVAWVATDLQVEGQPLRQFVPPLAVLRRQLERWRSWLQLPHREWAEFPAAARREAIADAGDSQRKPATDQLGADASVRA